MCAHLLCVWFFLYYIDGDRELHNHVQALMDYIRRLEVQLTTPSSAPTMCPPGHPRYQEAINRGATAQEQEGQAQRWGDYIHLSHYSQEVYMA